MYYHLHTILDRYPALRRRIGDLIYIMEYYGYDAFSSNILFKWDSYSHYFNLVYEGEEFYLDLGSIYQLIHKLVTTDAQY